MGPAAGRENGWQGEGQGSRSERRVRLERGKDLSAYAMTIGLQWKGIWVGVDGDFASGALSDGVDRLAQGFEPGGRG